MFQASYEARCYECFDDIKVGDIVLYEDEELVHGACFADRPSAPVCTTCFIEKPCECDD